MFLSACYSKDAINTLPEIYKNQLLDEVNKSYIKSEKESYGNKEYDYTTRTLLYQLMSMFVIDCHNDDKFHYSSCFYNKTVNITHNEMLAPIAKKYISAIDNSASLDEKAKVSLYFANYYKFMSRVYSDCNKEDILVRIECLNKVTFIEFPN
jgi:hypothetical protein